MLLSLRPTGIVTIAMLSVCVSLISFSAGAQTAPNKVIAKVADIEITERELALAEVDLLQQFAETPADQRRAAILNALIDIKLLAKSAEDEGLADEANFKARMAFTRSRTLHNEMFQKRVLEQISDEELMARYEIEIKGFPVEKEVSARHILVETEEAAKAIIVELDGGADFAELAKTKSTGPSGPNGGDLGYFGKGRMVPEFEEAVFALETGAFTKEPVKSQFGWHVIKKEDERDTQPPTFDQVKDQVRQVVAREKYFELTQNARKAYEFEILDEELKTKIEALQ